MNDDELLDKITGIERELSLVAIGWKKRQREHGFEPTVDRLCRERLTHIDGCLAACHEMRQRIGLPLAAGRKQVAKPRGRGRKAS